LDIQPGSTSLLKEYPRPVLWKFKDSFEPKPFKNCSKEELLEVVKSLTQHIQSLEGQINVLKHAQQAMISL
jgi:hypothetical protein